MEESSSSWSEKSDKFEDLSASPRSATRRLVAVGPAGRGLPVQELLGPTPDDMAGPVATEKRKTSNPVNGKWERNSRERQKENEKVFPVCEGWREREKEPSVWAEPLVSEFRIRRGV